MLDFGRSTPDEGTYKFKEQWGAEPVPLHWEYALLRGAVLPNASPTNPKFQLAIEMWKKLPLSSRPASARRSCGRSHEANAHTARRPVT